MNDRDVLDAAYDRLADFDFEYAGGLSDHGPMAAEALVRLGRAEAVEPWVEGHARFLQPRRPRVAPITDWRGSLGDRTRATDWLDLFTDELREQPWTHVLDSWAPRLIAGVFAAATHGVIRTAQAVRAIAEVDTPARRGELARGLALWASSYRELSGTPRPSGQREIRSVLGELARTSQSPGRGMITTAVVNRVADDPSFLAAVDSVVSPESADAALLSLTSEAARWYLASASQYPIAYVHALTGPAAARLLLPHLPPSTHADVYAYAWQVVAAMVATYGDAAETSAEPIGSVDEIIDRAVASGDEHAIKMTEACLREYRDRPDGIFLVAASDAAVRL